MSWFGNNNGAGTGNYPETQDNDHRPAGEKAQDGKITRGLLSGRLSGPQEEWEADD